MTDDSRTTKSAPKHPGTENAHEAWLAKTHAWSVGQGFDGALFGPDPRQYPLRAAAVTIDNDNDPRGPRDTVLPRHTTGHPDTLIAGRVLADIGPHEDLGHGYLR